MMKRGKQLFKNGKLEIYNKEIVDLVNQKVVQILTHEEANKAAVVSEWYLNHRIVERPDKYTSKLRVVFDSAAKYKGLCINNALEKGPNYTNLLLLLLKWNMYKVAMIM